VKPYSSNRSRIDISMLFMEMGRNYHGVALAVHSIWFHSSVPVEYSPQANLEIRSSDRSCVRMRNTLLDRAGRPFFADNNTPREIGLLLEMNRNG